MTIFKANTYIKISDSLFTGSTWSKSWQARIVLLTMLWLGYNSGGLVLVTIDGLARFAGLSIEDTEKGVEELETPDPRSRTKKHLGCTIKPIDGGGWQILNHDMYQEMMNGKPIDVELPPLNGTNGNGNNSHPNPTSNNSLHSMKENENENERSHRSAIPGKRAEFSAEVSAEVNADFYTGAEVNAEGWHLDERRVYESLPVGHQRKAFPIIRGFAERAAGVDEATFPIAQGPLAKKLGCSQRNVSDVLKKYVEVGCIVQTAHAKPYENRAAEYRWTLETTLPLPAHAGMDIEEGDPF
jgi:hypothetical protein